MNVVVAVVVSAVVVEVEAVVGSTGITCEENSPCLIK